MEHSSDMEVRRRSNRGPGPRGDDSGSPVKRSRTKSQSVDSGFTTVIAVAFVVVLGGAAVFLFAPGVKEAVFARFGLVERQHAVVIDAGSTGSRVLGFKFHRDGSGALQLDDELWVQDKPGLSSYADSPSGAAESISRLLAEAKSFIPESGWAQTPLTLRATAGLRLLPKDQSDAIIGEVEKVLRSSGFRPEDPLIEIMNPMEEGLFAWFTVNFLLDQFTKPVVDSYVTLDLGGGSTQIVFVPGARVEDLEKRRHYMHDVSVMKNTIAMYSHSYLGLGLMTARKAMFKISDEVSKVSSVCVSSRAPLTFKFQNKEFTIERDEKASAEGCLELALAAVEAEGVHAPAELAGRNISGFSYFYDTPAERGMVKEVVGGVVRVGDYRAEARKACAEADSGFYCADLSFMYAMLSRGYGLSDAKEIRLFKKIDGHEVSWALGCAYNILEG